MKISALLMQKEQQVFSIEASANIGEAVGILNNNHIGALIVTGQDGSVDGIVTERDILQNLPMDLEKVRVSDIMTPGYELVIIHEEDNVDYAMAMFTSCRIRHLPVFREKEVIGIISIGDVIKALLKDSSYENKMLKDYIYNPYL